MTTPFAALQTRLNAAVQARLANAQAVLASGLTVQGEFDEARSDNPFDVAGHDLTFTAPSADLIAMQYGSQIALDGQTYTVRATQPAGAGFTRLILERA